MVIKINMLRNMVIRNIMQVIIRKIHLLDLIQVLRRKDQVLVVKIHVINVDNKVIGLINVKIALETKEASMVVQAVSFKIKVDNMVDQDLLKAKGSKSVLIVLALVIGQETVHSQEDKNRMIYKVVMDTKDLNNDLSN